LNLDAKNAVVEYNGYAVELKRLHCTSYAQEDNVKTQHI